MKKWSAVLISAVLLTGVIGCSQSKENGQAGASSAPKASDAKSDALLDLNMMTFSFAGGGWQDDHPVIKELNKKLNINLKIQWIPLDNYAQKLNVMAASNDFPDLFIIQEPEFNKWRDKGVFLDLKPELGKYPNFAKYLDAKGLEIMNPKDKVYGLPYYITEARDSLMIRKDWLDKLGLKAPTNTDEFLEVAKAFALKDPDGNGQADTSGFSFSIINNKFANGGADFLLGAFGLGNEWAEKNGQLVPMQVQTEELKALMSFLKKAYAEGALDKDFPTNKVKDPVAKLESGKAGITTVVPNEVYLTNVPTLKKLVPAAELVQLLPPKGPTGLQATHTMPVTNKIVINAKIDPAKQQRALKFLDYLLSDEGYDLIKHGIEGVHYKKTADGKFEKTDAFDKERPQLISAWFFRRYDVDVQIRKWDDQEYANKIRSLYQTNEKYVWRNPAAGLSSETLTKKGVSLQQKWMEAMLKIIVGQTPVSAVDDAAAAWKKDGGDDIIKEINAEYQKLK